MSVKTAHVDVEQAPDLALEVVTDTNRGASIGIHVRAATIEVWSEGRTLTVFDQAALRDWLRTPHGRLEGTVNPAYDQPVTFSAVGFRDMAITLPGVTEWPLSPTEVLRLHDITRRP